MNPVSTGKMTIVNAPTKESSISSLYTNVTGF